MASSERIGRQRYTDGRDEMNLADFPISVLQRQQPVGADGLKQDTVTFEASRYDPRTRQRVQQRVVLESNARYGLPTPADENVILALLHVAKHSHNFADALVYFAPRQLFQIMGWAPNSRSYDRLRDVLRRLKALVIRYENAWWDIAGRSYEAEMATGIVVEYEISRQLCGRKKGGATPPCWVRWSPHFQQSLSNGNLKKLDLEKLFALRLPSSQRMYRFLDKRFYQAPTLEMDLVDFACGHIGLNRVDNIAELKRRLLPAIEELEGIGFLRKIEPEQRFQKVRAGVWRVRFEAGIPEAPRLPDQPSSTKTEVIVATPQPFEVSVEQRGADWQLAADYYRTWDPRQQASVGANDLARANYLLAQFGPERAKWIILHLVRIVKKRWPECRTLSGAMEKYLPDALRSFESEQRRLETRQETRIEQQRLSEEQQQEQEQTRLRAEQWGKLPEVDQRAIEAEVLNRHPEHRNRPAILRVLCLDELAKRLK